MGRLLCLQNQRSAAFILCAVSGKFSDGKAAAPLTRASFPIRAIGMPNWRVSRERTSRWGILRDVPRRLAAEARANCSLIPVTGKGRKSLISIVEIIVRNVFVKLLFSFSKRFPAFYFIAEIKYSLKCIKIMIENLRIDTFFNVSIIIVSSKCLFYLKNVLKIINITFIAFNI